MLTLLAGCSLNIFGLIAVVFIGQRKNEKGIEIYNTIKSVSHAKARHS
jgi:hypothetical protein